MRRVTAAAALGAAVVLAGSGPASAAVQPAGVRPVVAAACPHDMGDMGGMDMSGPGHGSAAAAPAADPECMIASEYDFLVHMIPHHAEAVATAKYLLKSKRPQVREFGKAIIAAQSSEIERMQGWLKKWYPGKPAEVDYTPEMPDFSKVPAKDVDRVFLISMQDHHNHAIAMAQRLLDEKLVAHKEVGPFAKAIIEAQTKENKMMRAWLKKWYGKSA